MAEENVVAHEPDWCNQLNPWRPLGHVLDLYVLPLICVSGLLLNLACLVVFSRRRAHPIVPALMMLSICDSLQLLFSIFVLYLPALHDHLDLDPYGWLAQVCYVATGSLAGGLLASNCASIWTICFISIQRHRAIISPLSTISHSKSSAHLPLCAIGVAALLFNAPVWFEFNWEVARIRPEGLGPGMENATERSILWHSKSNLSRNYTYRFVMGKVLYPLVVYFLPLILISVLNMRILSFISSSRIQSVGHKRRMAKERRSVMLLISIVLLFFVCHTGGLVIRLVDLSEYNSPCFIFGKDLVNLGFNINSFANPMLYFIFTKNFRDLRTTWSSAANSHANSQGGSAKTKRLIEKPSNKDSPQ